MPYLIIKQAGTLFCHSLSCVISNKLLLYFITASIVYSSSKLLLYFTSFLFCFVTRSLTLTAQPQPTVYWTHLHCSVQPSFFTNVALISSELKSWTSLLIVPFPRSSLNFSVLFSACNLRSGCLRLPRCTRNVVLAYHRQSSRLPLGDPLLLRRPFQRATGLQ